MSWMRPFGWVDWERDCMGRVGWLSRFLRHARLEITTGISMARPIQGNTTTSLHVQRTSVTSTYLCHTGNTSGEMAVAAGIMVAPGTRSVGGGGGGNDEQGGQQGRATRWAHGLHTCTPLTPRWRRRWVLVAASCCNLYVEWPFPTAEEGTRRACGRIIMPTKCL